MLLRQQEHLVPPFISAYIVSSIMDIAVAGFAQVFFAVLAVSLGVVLAQSAGDVVQGPDLIDRELGSYDVCQYHVVWREDQVLHLEGRISVNVLLFLLLVAAVGRLASGGLFWMRGGVLLV